jgi:C4-dicarboxylate-specific signal transduction histidine kinase
MNKITSSKGIIISLINITEHKKASFEIQRHKDNIQHNARMIELGEMVGGVAHEINNPLSISIGKMFLLKNMLEKGNLDKDKINKHVNDSNIALDRISKIVSRMKSISRKSEEDPFTNESFEAIMDVVILMTSPKMKEKNVKFINAISSKNIDLFCRPSQIEQVLINLFNNSVDAIEKYDERWIKIETVNEEENIMLKITDSGPGITEEIRNNIWNSFYTTKENGKGTGLGLSISLQIIESHNGKIYIDTNCANTCFVIELQKSRLAKQSIG